MDEQERKREDAKRWERRKREWRVEFGGWLGWICGFWDGMNPSLSEEEQLEALLGEIEFMAKPMRERLEELQALRAGKAVHHGNDH